MEILRFAQNSRSAERMIVIMPKRRICKFADKSHKNVDLTQYSQIIIDTINNTVPGKNPQVDEHSFSTDELSHKESVKLGRALASLGELEVYGKQVTIFRLFNGKVVDTEKTDDKPKIKRKPIGKNKPTGGRMK